MNKSFPKFDCGVHKLKSPLRGARLFECYDPADEKKTGYLTPAYITVPKNSTIVIPQNSFGTPCYHNVRTSDMTISEIFKKKEFHVCKSPFHNGNNVHYEKGKTYNTNLNLSESIEHAEGYHFYMDLDKFKDKYPELTKDKIK